MKKAARETQSQKYSAAIVSYCEVARLLKDSVEDETYKEALERVKDIEVKLGYRAGHTQCIKKNLKEED